MLTLANVFFIVDIALSAVGLHIRWIGKYRVKLSADKVGSDIPDVCVDRSYYTVKSVERGVSAYQFAKAFLQFHRVYFFEFFL